MSKRGVGAFIGGLAIGSAVGSAIGLLVAPRSGQETRKILKKSAQAVPEIAQDITSSVQLQADRFSETTLSNWGSTLTRLQEAIAAGVEASKMETTSSEENAESPSSKSE